MLDTFASGALVFLFARLKLPFLMRAMQASNYSDPVGY
jgi:hypothetical protein